MRSRALTWPAKRVLLAIAGLVLLGAPAALAGGPVGGMPKGGLYYYVGSDSMPAAENVAERQTICSEPGTRVVGGGFDTDTGSQTGVLYRSHPFNSSDGDDRPDDGWWTWAQRRRAGDLTIQSYAICSFDPVKYRSRDERLEPDETGTVKAFCPDAGRVTSGGVEIPNDGAVEVSGTYPIDGADAGTKPDDGWAAKVWNFTQSRAFVTVHAVCVVGVKTQYVSFDQPIGMNTTLAIFTAGCSDDAYITGAGLKPLSPLTTEGSGITAAAPVDWDFDVDTVPDNRALIESRNDDAAGTMRHFIACIRRA